MKRLPVNADGGAGLAPSVTLARRMPRDWAWFVFLATLAAIVPLTAWIVATLAGHGHSFNDFNDYWLAGKLVAAGHSPYNLNALRAIAAAEGRVFVVGTGYSYPLPFALLMVPFAALPFTAAVLLFNGLSLVLFGSTVAGWIQWAQGAADPRRQALLALLAGAYPPVYGTIANGQANLVVLGLLAFGAALVLESPRRRGRRGWRGRGGRWGRGGRELLGGVAIGLAAIVKLVPGLVFVPVVLARRGPAAAGILAGALGSLVLAYLLVPGGGSRSELTSLFEPDSYFTNQSINGFVTRLVEPSDRTVPLFSGAFGPRLPMLVLTATFAIVTAVVLWRARGRIGATRRGLALGIAFALVAGLIGAPKGSYWNQAAALVAVGLLLAVDVPDRRPRWPDWLDWLGQLDRIDRGLLVAWFGGSLVQLILWLAPPPKQAPFAVVVTLLESASTYGLVALWLLFARRLNRSDLGLLGDPVLEVVPRHEPRLRVEGGQVAEHETDDRQ